MAVDAGVVLPLEGAAAVLAMAADVAVLPMEADVVVLPMEAAAAEERLAALRGPADDRRRSWAVVELFL